MLPIYLIATAVTLVSSLLYAWWRRLNCGLVLFSNVTPVGVAVLMAWIFLIMRGSTTAQFVSGSERGMDLWEMWFNLWPVLLFGTFLWSLIHFVLLIVAICKKSMRVWIPVIVATLLLTIFAFFTVASRFPDA